MHEILDAMEEINLSPLEYGTLCQTIYHTASPMAIYMPKLMAGIPYGTKRSWSEPVGNIFANDTGCAISYGKSVQLQNFLSIPRYLNSDFHYRADINGYLHPGTKFTVQSMYGNPKDLRLERVL